MALETAFQIKRDGEERFVSLAATPSTEIDDNGLGDGSTTSKLFLNTKAEIKEGDILRRQQTLYKATLQNTNEANLLGFDRYLLKEIKNDAS